MQRHRDRRGQDIRAQKSRKADCRQRLESNERSEPKKHAYSHSQSDCMLRILQSQEFFALFPEPSNRIHRGEVNLGLFPME